MRRHGPADDPYGNDEDDVDDLETLGDQIATLAAHIHAATHRLLRLVAEFDRRRGWKLDGHRSCAHWLAYRTGIELVTAREKVRVARALRDLPQTDHAMSRGEVSFAKVRAISRAATPTNEGELLAFARETTAAQLEHTVRSMKLLSRRDEVERERERHRWRSFSVFPDGAGMYEVRGRLDPEVAAVLMRAIEAASDAVYGTTCEVEEVEPQQRRADAVGLVAERAFAAGFADAAAGVEPARRGCRSEGKHGGSLDSRQGSWAEDTRGGCAENGQAGRPESGHSNRSGHGNAYRPEHASTETRDVPAATAVHEPRNASAEARDIPAATVVHEPRNTSAEARNIPAATAVHESRNTSAEARDVPAAATVHDSRNAFGEARDRPEAAPARESRNASAEERYPPPTSEHVASHSWLTAANGVPSAAAAAHEGRAGGTNGGSGHVSAEELHRALSAGRAERYQVVVHVDPDTLRSGVESGRSELADGTRLSPETARRLSCDAGLVRATRGRDGSILDVGRRTRTVPPALRRALEIRDGGCRFPGCGSRFVEAHHVVHWADGGETSLTNCCLLCRRHHRLVHEEGFTIHYPPGGSPTFYTPRGLPVPDRPPRLPAATLEALVRANLHRGVIPDGWTCTARYEREAEIPWPVLARVLDAIDS